MDGLSERFTGGVFSEQLEGGRSGAELSLTSQAIVATTEDGRLFSIPFRECKLSVGGNSGKIWFCRSSDHSVTIFSEAKGFAAALRVAGRRELAEQLAAVEEATRSQERRSLVWGAGILAAVALVLLGLAFGVRYAGRLSVMALPPSVDVRLGKLALENIDLGGPVVHDEVLDGAVTEVLKRLSRAAPSPFSFEARVVDSSQENAFALPGGPIVVYTGLLRIAESPEQLAGVLAHEMAHVTCRHGMQRIAQSLGVVTAIQLLFGDVSGIMALAVEALRVGTINSYSRDAEQEADMTAIERLHKARLDADALANFFARLQANQGDSQLELPWLGTHPELEQRIKSVRSRVAKLGAVTIIPLEIDWAEVQKRAGGEGS